MSDTNGSQPTKKSIKIPNVGNEVNRAKAAFTELTGQSVTPLEFNRQQQQITNQKNYQILRQDKAKLQQETRKADIEEKRIEIFDAQYKEIGHRVNTAWLKADVAEIEYQIATVDKELAMVAKDTREIELATQKDNKAIAEEKRELNYLKGLEDLRALSLGISEKVYESDTREVVLEVNGSEVINGAIPTKASIKAFLIGG